MAREECFDFFYCLVVLVVLCLLQGKDSLALVPTGLKESLIYQSSVLANEKLSIGGDLHLWRFDLVVFVLFCFVLFLITRHFIETNINIELQP